jgi:hypothetical protein
MSSEINEAVAEVTRLVAIAKRAKTRAEQAAGAAEEAQHRLATAQERLQVLRDIQASRSALTAAMLKLQRLNGESATVTISCSSTELGSTEIGSAKPRLALPRLLPDLSDVDSSRDHLDLQCEQIVAVFRILSSKASPYVQSDAIKKYIEENFEIDHPEYWKARTGPKEPERWWKQIYDKAIERMDLTLHLIARSDVTGKKGVYALREYLEDQPQLFQQQTT